MRSVLMFAIALAFTFFSGISIGREPSLPKSAELTKDGDGNVTAVRIAGKSNRERIDLPREAVEALSKLTHLQSLSLWGTTVDDDDIDHLAGLANLRTIDLTFTDVTGESLRALSSLKNLLSIRLEGCDVKDEHLAPVTEMPQLAMLYLGRTNVTDAGLTHLRGLKNLNLLQLSDCTITDSGLASLGDLPVIQHLWLSKTIRYGTGDRSNLTDNSIDYLASLDTLIDLQIADSQLTDAGLERLRDGLPKAKVSTVRTGVTYVDRKKP
ncbi:Leucine Rich repeats (2 copies) [Rubripirellula lacrimiformis]|uniref:Leucine Rich repeats (2 copies) n=1 Tax=Rubripirellula lacrimiformis TaxID=1930273 RepID=A0A517N3P7_9BACT|nr:hypothetical protein [Rubripirellula lacrimiformis]QDT01757.1 Leucine Rich repeats (2 copies) [Rubripirellula lacrimiformis]